MNLLRELKKIESNLFQHITNRFDALEAKMGMDSKTVESVDENLKDLKERNEKLIVGLDQAGAGEDLTPSSEDEEVVISEDDLPVEGDKVGESLAKVNAGDVSEVKEVVPVVKKNGPGRPPKVK